MKCRLNNEEETFNICRSMKQSCELQMISAISYKVECISEVQIAERLGVEALAEVIMDFESDGIEEHRSLVASLEGNEYQLKLKKLELDMKHHESPPAKLSIEEAPKLELMPLPPNLKYVFLSRYYTLSIIIVVDLSRQQVECLVEVLKRFKRDIGWTISDIIGIPPGNFFTQNKTHSQ